MLHFQLLVGPTHLHHRQGLFSHSGPFPLRYRLLLLVIWCEACGGGGKEGSSFSWFSFSVKQALCPVPFPLQPNCALYLWELLYETYPLPPSVIREYYFVSMQDPGLERVSYSSHSSRKLLVPFLLRSRDLCQGSESGRVSCLSPSSFRVLFLME